MGNRLYVGNLAFQTTESAIRDVFVEVGDVTEVRLITDRDSGQSRGFAFVTMSSDDEAQKAIEACDGRLVDGRSLRVNEAQERQSRGGGGGGGYGGGGGGYGGGGGGGGGRGGRGGGGGGGYGGGGGGGGQRW